MKSIKREDLAKIRAALATAYHEKEKAEMVDQWLVKAMGHIRGLGPRFNRISYFELFQRLVWRLTPVTCALAVGLGVAMTQVDFFSVYELTRIFINDPSDFILLALYNG